MLDIRLGCASICKRVVGHIHWEFFFGAATFPFRFGQFVSLLTEAIFSFNFWETACYCFIRRSQKWPFLGSIFGFSLEPKSIFVAFVAGNSRLTCVGRDRMRAE